MKYEIHYVTISLSVSPLHILRYFFFCQEDMDNKYVIRKKKGEAWKPLLYLHDLCDNTRKLHSKYRH